MPFFTFCILSSGCFRFLCCTDVVRFGGFVCLIFDKYLLEVMVVTSVEFTGSRLNCSSSRLETFQAAEGMKGFMYVICLISLKYVVG